MNLNTMDTEITNLEEQKAETRITKQIQNTNFPMFETIELSSASLRNWNHGTKKDAITNYLNSMSCRISKTLIQ